MRYLVLTALCGYIDMARNTIKYGGNDYSVFLAYKVWLRFF